MLVCGMKAAEMLGSGTCEAVRWRSVQAVLAALGFLGPAVETVVGAAVSAPITLEGVLTGWEGALVTA